MSDEPSPSPDAQPAKTAAPPDAPPDKPIANEGTAQWPITVRYGVGIILIAICVLGVLLVLPLLQVILLSFLIAFVMFLPSRGLSRRLHLPYGLSVVISFVAAAAIIIGLAVLLLPDVVGMFRSIGDAVHQATSNIIAQLQNSPASIEVAGMTIDTANLSAALQHLNLPAEAASIVTAMAHLFFGFFTNAATLAAAIGTASIVALFFLIGLPISGGTMTNWVPKPYQREIALLFGKLDVLWTKFFRALIIIGVITGAASFVLFELFGIKGALLLAIATAAIGLIPYLGRIFAILLVFFAALVNGSTRFTGMDNLTFAVLTIIAYLIVTQTIGTIVSPRLKGSALNVPVVAIVVGVMVGITIAGILGALLVAPVIGSVRVFMQYSIAKILLRDPYPNETSLPLQEEGFFSHMLYVKKKKEAADADAAQP
jgi:predicted PurR-regulated permease PerM